MQVALPSSTGACIGRTISCCFASTSFENWWQPRHARESLALYSVHTCPAMRIRSFLNFSSVEMMPRISPMTSLVPATALYQRSSGYSLGMWQSWHVARYAGAVRAMDALPVFLRDPLHRVARPSAEFIGARDMDHHLGAE